MAREHKTTPQYPIIALPLEDTDIVEVWRDGKQYHVPFAALGGVPDAHAPSHGLNGTDPVGTDTPDPNVIPVSDGQGTLDSWISDASTTKKGKVQLADSLESAAGKAMQSNDPRGSNARTPTAHVDSHLTGSDQIPDATTSARGLMGNGDKSKLEAIDTELIPSNDEKAALGVLSPVVGALAGTSGVPSASNPFVTDEDARLELIPSAGEKAALAGSYGTPSAVNRFITETDPVLSSIGGGGGGTTGPDLIGIGQIGNGLSINNGNPALASLNSTDVAFIENVFDELRCYTFDGTNWTQKGNGLPISNVNNPALASLNSTDIAFIDSDNDELRCYTFDETDWTQKGNGLPISSVAYPALASLNSTDVAFIDYSNDELRCYTFDGTDWTQKGNGLPISNVASPALASLSSTDVAFVDNFNKELRTYNFLFGYDSASVNVSADYEVPELATGKSIVIRRTSAYDGDPVTITPPSGATFEGRASLSLYGQYSFVELERISSTVFAVRDLQDDFYFTPILSFSLDTTGITYARQEGRVTIKRFTAFIAISIILTSKGTATGIARVAIPSLLYGSSQVDRGTYDYFGQNIMSTGHIKGLSEAVDSSNILLFSYTIEDGVQTQITNNEFANNSAFRLFGTVYL